MKRTRTTAILLVIFSIAASFFPPTALPGDISRAANQEIQHLLGYIEGCGCQFCRNGTWYQDSKVVRQHVELKYGYFMKRGQINSTEDFIKWSASKSEMSGKPYLVKCGQGSPSLLAQWLSDELERYRKKEGDTDATDTSRGQFSGHAEGTGK